MFNKTFCMTFVFVLLGIFVLSIRIVFGACETGCDDLVSFYEDDKKWAFVSSTGAGATRTYFSSAPLVDVNGSELTCYKKEAVPSTECVQVCSGCAMATAPCKLDTCEPGSGAAESYTCYESCTE